MKILLINLMSLFLIACNAGGNTGSHQILINESQSKCTNTKSGCIKLTNKFIASNLLDKGEISCLIFQ